MRIALTGNMGCGVSEVARRLEAKGLPLISADEIGHELLKIPEIKNELRDAFGEAIFTSAGEIDRQQLGQIVFADETARTTLNRIVHPQLVEALTSLAREAERQHGRVVVDAALIYEWGIAGFFHTVVVVDAPLEVRLQRIMQRDQLTREQAVQRMAAQWPLEQKVEKGDAVIKNSGTLEELEKDVDELVRKLAGR